MVKTLLRWLHIRRPVRRPDTLLPRLMHAHAPTRRGWHPSMGPRL